MADELSTRRGTTTAPDPETAVKELAAQLYQPGMKFVLLFASADYDLPRLAEELRRQIPCPVYGCTTAGHIGPHGLEPRGIGATSFAGGALEVVPFHVRALGQCMGALSDVGRAVQSALEAQSDSRKAFVLTFVDGLARAEERLVSALYRSIGDLPIVGGSAGDGLRFERTHVLVDGEFVSDAAAILLVRTSLPFVPFNVHHFEPTSRRLIVTRAHPDERVVHELNGERASHAYAEALGLRPEQLDDRVFLDHPLILSVQGEPFVRSVRSVHPDGSMTFFCALEDGLVLSVGTARDPEACLRETFAGIERSIGKPEIVIGFDCVVRRREFDARGWTERIGRLYADHGMVGFSTYGEQYNALHLNQTLTGVAVAR